MIRRWEQGRPIIDEMIASRQLERVPANVDLAHAHLEISILGTDKDAVGSFQLAYDAARKALASLLVVQGLRPTSQGGHIAVYDAVMAQFGNVLEKVLRPFSSMRRLRNSSEYPSLEHPVANADDARRAQAQANEMVDAAARLVDMLPVY